MYLRLTFEGRGDYVVWLDGDVSQHLPLESRASRWKQEIYFPVPFELGGEETLSVRRGDVAFWPPGRGFCLFYGYSQPYSPVVKIGVMLGVPQDVSTVEDGSSVRLDQYVDYGSAGEVARFLRDRGFKAASCSWGDEDNTVLALVEHGPSRVGVKIYVEDYGLHLQSEPIAFFDSSPSTIALIEALSPSLPPAVRLDLDDEGFIVLTGFCREREELPARLERLLSGFVYAEKFMGSFYGVRRP